MTLNCFGISRLIGLKWPLVGCSFLPRVQTGISDCSARLALQELRICHQIVNLLSHFGLHANDLEESGECGILPEMAGAIVTIYVRARNKIAKRW